MIGRCALLAATAFAIVGMVASSSAPWVARPRQALPSVQLPKLLMWNASASVPTGLYLLRSATSLKRGEMVAVTPPGPLASWLSNRGYLPAGVPLLKHIAALAGQTICRQDDTVTIDGAAVAKALHHDHLRRPLPVWQGCRQLRAGEVFLLNAAADSMDGRYFGPLPATAVRAEALPLWTEAAQ